MVSLIYLYDNAIVDDLSSSFNEDISNPVVRVVSPESSIGIVAQIQEDDISFPIVVLERQDPISLDSRRYNFVNSKRGVDAVFEKEENNYYKEQSIPIDLSYKLTVLTSSQEDLDEIIREIMFKYTSMYFMDIRIPYESNRDISFGVIIDSQSGIQQESGISQYTQSGQLFQASIILKCEGCVLINYVPVHIKRTVYDIEAK